MNNSTIAVYTRGHERYEVDVIDAGLMIEIYSGKEHTGSCGPFRGRQAIKQWMRIARPGAQLEGLEEQEARQ